MIRIFTPRNIVYGLGSAVIAGLLTAGGIRAYDEAYREKPIQPNYVNNKVDLDKDGKKDAIVGLEEMQTPEVLLRRHTGFVRLEDALNHDLSEIDSDEKERLQSLKDNYAQEKRDAVSRD